MKIAIFIIAFTLVAALAPAGPGAWAQDDQPLPATGLDELLDGFEEPADPVPNGTSAEDDFLQGFEEDTFAVEAPSQRDAERAPAWQLDGELAFTTRCK